MNLSAILRSLALTAALAGVVGCTNGGGSSSDSGGGTSGGTTGGTSGGQSGDKFTTDCGVLEDRAVVSTVDRSDGMPATDVQVVTSDTLILTLANGPVLIKLAGLSDGPSFLSNFAVAKLAEITPKGALFYPAGPDCTTVSHGNQALIGTVLTNDGISYAEYLLKAGAARIGISASCGEQGLGTCYNALRTDAPNVGGIIGQFLWKPESDEAHGNRLVVIIDWPNATIVVNGETLRVDQPGSRTFGRGSKPGCGYGPVAHLTAKNNKGEDLLFPNNKLSMDITNPCQRVDINFQ